MNLFEQPNNPEDIYELDNVVGHGNFGKVYKAYKKSNGAVVAIKILPINEDDERQLKKLVDEIKVLKECDSEYVVKYYGSFLKDSELWIVMEFCDAGSLAAMINRLNKPLNEEQIAAAMYSVSCGLAYLHRHKLIHRDIKADNVLLNSKGEAKLATARTYNRNRTTADMGVVAQLAGTLDQRRTATGTPYWMAPELVQEQQYGTKVDVWSMGITAIECAEKRPPFFDMLPMRALFTIANPDKPPPTLSQPEKWSEEFRSFVTQCLTRDPMKRPSCQELLRGPFLKKGEGESGAAVLKEYVKEYLEFEELKKREKEEKRRQYLARREKQKSKESVIAVLNQLGDQSMGRTDTVAEMYYFVCSPHALNKEKAPWGDKMIGDSTLSGVEQALEKVASQAPYLKHIKDVVAFLQHPRSGVSISTRTHRMRRYKDCFSGSEAVDWFATFLRLTRPEACAIGEHLMHRGYVQHVLKAEGFRDKSTVYYRFVENDNDFSGILSLISNLMWYLNVRDIKHRGKTYKNCFYGYEFVDSMMDKLELDDRDDVIDIGQMLLDRCVIYNVTYSDSFSDSKSLYRLYVNPTGLTSETRYSAMEKANRAVEELRKPV